VLNTVKERDFVSLNFYFPKKEKIPAEKSSSNKYYDTWILGNKNICI